MIERRNLERGRPDFEALVESVNGIVWEGDPATLRFLYVSGQAERLLGYPAKRWTEEPDFWTRHLHPDDREWAPNLCRESSEQGIAHELEYRMTAADGRTVWLRDIVSVVIEEGRAPISRGVMIDITQQKRVEAERRIAAERLRRFTENAPLVMFILDRNGVVTDIHGKSLEIAGVDPSEVIGRPLSDWARMTPEMLQNLDRELAGEEFSSVVEFEGRMYMTSFSTLRNDEGEVHELIGVAADVTERVRAEEERERLQARVQYAQKLESLGVLAGGIAHDFNNLLMTVLGNTDLALSALPRFEPAREHVARAQRASRRAADLTQQLLAYSGQAPRETRTVDLSSLVSEIVDLLPVFAAGKAGLELRLADDLPPIEGDASQLTQVVLNLVTNASEALDERGGTVEIFTDVIELRAGALSSAPLCDDLSPGPYVCLQVRDDGAGMDSETQSRIFDPFFTTKLTGRGLGLASVLGIVRSHRGTIGVESRPGVGTTFRALFPRGEGRAHPVAPGSPRDDGFRGSGTLLVVDDDEGVRETTEEFARRLGFQVHVAEGGPEAMEVLRSAGDAIDAVLLDVNMPGMRGDEAVRALRSIRPGIRIVLMTGFSREHAEARLAGNPVAGFLQKPFDPSELGEVLRTALGSD